MCHGKRCVDRMEKIKNLQSGMYLICLAIEIQLLHSIDLYSMFLSGSESSEAAVTSRRECHDKKLNN